MRRFCFTLRTKNLDKTWPVSCLNIKWGGRYSLFYPVTNFRSSSAGSSRHERQIHSRVETRLDQGVMIQRDPNSRCDNDKNDKLGPDHPQTFCDIVWLLFSSDAPGLRLMETSLLWLSSDQRFWDDDCGWGGVDDDVVINWSKNKCVEILINVWWVTSF